jgi:hypothetical protein
MLKVAATNVENFDSLVSTGMNWANKVRVIANGIGACVGNASFAIPLLPALQWPVSSLRQPKDDVAITLAGSTEPPQAIEGRPIQPDPDEAVRARGRRGVIQL